MKSGKYQLPGGKSFARDGNMQCGERLSVYYGGMDAEQIGRRIAAARHEAGLTQAQLAKAVGRSRNTVPNWEGGQNIPAPSIMEQIAQATGKPVVFFYTGDRESGGAADLAETVRRLERLLGAGAVQSASDVAAGGLAIVPVYGSAAAGMGGIADREPDEYRQIPVAWIPQGQTDCVLVEVHGDSMVDAGISEGELLLACPSAELSDGQIAVVEIGDEVMVRRVYREGDAYLLTSDRPQVAPRIVRRDEVRWIGRIVWARRSY